MAVVNILSGDNTSQQNLRSEIKHSHLKSFCLSILINSVIYSFIFHLINERFYKWYKNENIIYKKCV